MGEITLFQVLSLVLGFASTIVAFGAFVRVGKWRTSDDGKKMTTKVTELDTGLSLLATRLAGFEQSDVLDRGAAAAAASRLQAAESSLMALDIRLSNTEQLGQRIIDMDHRMVAIETTLKHMASRADFESLKAEVGAVERVARNTQAGVERIESFLMERAG